MTEDAVEETRTRRLGLPKLVELILTAAAPLTIITALLVHVGSVRNRAFFGYFGIDLSVLRPSIQDYVLRSVDVTFGAVARLVAATVVVIVLNQLVVRVMVRRQDHRGVGYGQLHAVLLAVGGTLGAVGLLVALGLGRWLDLPPLFAAVLLAVGSGVVLRLRSAPFVPDTDKSQGAKAHATATRPGNHTSGHRLNGRGQPNGARLLGLPMTVALYATLVIALFWAVTLYAQDLGQRSARAVDANPEALPLVTIYSERYLDLPGSLVHPTRAPGAEGEPHYRYTGLSLLTYSNGTWFLITGRYSDRYRSSILLLPDTQSIRVELAEAQ
jgi:hypothetical protein